MPLQIIRNDITKVKCDAVVNAANETLLGGGGVDGAIHRAAGKKLLLECLKLGGCKTGHAKITKGYKMPCKYIIHTVGPKWKGGGNGEKDLLISCYQNSLELAKKYNCRSVAFPLISAGVYRYPIDEAFNIAVNTCAQFLMNNDMLIYIVVYNREAVNAGSKIFSDISKYIDDNYVKEHTDSDYEAQRQSQCSMPIDERAVNNQNTAVADCSTLYFNEEDKFNTCSLPKPEQLKNIIDSTIDESFSQMLLRKIDEKNMSDSECYKKANIDKRLFSKIRSNKNYRPSKPTALAFAIALELDISETKQLLEKAGYALSHSSKFDIIVEYFIKHKNYNVFDINEALFAFDQNLLGSVN